MAQKISSLQPVVTRGAKFLNSQRYRDNLQRGIEEQIVIELGPTPSAVWRDLQQQYRKGRINGEYGDLGGVKRLLGLGRDGWDEAHTPHTGTGPLGFHVDGRFDVDYRCEDDNNIYSSELIIAINTHPTLYAPASLPILTRKGRLVRLGIEAGDFHPVVPIQLKPKTFYYMPAFTYHDRPGGVAGERHMFRLARTATLSLGNPRVIDSDDWTRSRIRTALATSLSDV